MCVAVIIDASVFGQFLEGGFSILRSWTGEGDGVIVYTGAGKYGDEIKRSGKFLEWLREQREVGVKEVSAEEFWAADNALKDRNLLSNDRHIISLALAGDASVLATDDGNLMDDFKNPQLLPKVGRRKRAVYPVNVSLGRQRQFFRHRRCRRK